MLVLLLAACVASPPAGVAVPGIEKWAGTKMFRPKGEARAAIVILHGSEGGAAPYAPALAQRFAAEGLLAASFCWFGCDGLPTAVHRVSLDRTVEFLTWLESGPAAGLPVVLYGASRGAEQAVLLASLLGDAELIDGVAVHAASDTVVAAYDPATRGAFFVEGGFDAAWTWHGGPLYGERAMPFHSGPRIAIERYPGPVLLSHGEEDPLWPASRSRGLEAARKGLPTEVHYWPGEGHILMSHDNVETLVRAIVAFANRTPR